MPEQAENKPPQDEAKPSTAEAPLTPEQRDGRELDIRQVVPRIIRQRVPRPPTSEERRAIDADAAAKAIYSSEHFSQLTAEQFVAGQADALKGIEYSGREGRGKILEFVKEGDQIKIIYEEGDGAGAITYPEPLDRKKLFEANMVAERAAIEAGFKDEQQVVVKAYLDTLDPHAPKDRALPDKKTILKAAEKTNLVTADQTIALIGTLPKDVQLDTDEVKKIVQGLEGRIFADPEDFAAIVTITGENKDAFSGKIVDLRASIDTLKADIQKLQSDRDALPPDDTAGRQVFEDKIKEAEKEKAKAGLQESAYNQAKQVLKKQEDEEAAKVAEREAERQRFQTPEADAKITEKLNKLQVQLNDEKAKDTKEFTTAQELEDHKKMIKSLTSQVGVMELAEKGKGKAGAVVKFIALQNAIDNAGTFEKTQLEAVQKNLEPQLAASKQVLLDLVDSSALTDPQKAAMKKALEGKANASELTALLASGEITQINGFAEAVFGERYDGNAIDGAINNIVDGAGLNDAQKAEVKKKLLMGGGLALLLAAILAVGPTLAVLSFVGKGAKSSFAKAA